MAHCIMAIIYFCNVSIINLSVCLFVCPSVRSPVRPSANFVCSCTVRHPLQCCTDNPHSPIARAKAVVRPVPLDN